MKRYLFVLIVSLVLASLLSACGAAAEQPLDLSAGYEIDALLELSERRMVFDQRVTVTNNGEHPASELWFQLRANRFAAGDARLSVSSVTCADGSPLEFELSGYDQLCRVALPEPLEGGSDIELCFACELGIPECSQLLGVDRFGQIQLPYFYVQLAVCDENGWDKSCWPEGEAETDGRYGSPSDFCLTVTAPESYGIASNGRLVSRETDGGLTRWEFEAENRREIILTASENYVLREAEVDGVSITALFYKNINTVADMDAAMEAAAFGLRYFSNAFGPYPYDELVISTGAVPANGMAASLESSGMFTIQLDSSTNYTLYHELAHQWFYCLVGNSEVTDCWLDEGFATWAGYICMGAAGEDSEIRWELCALDSDSIADRGYKFVNIPLDEGDHFKIVFYERGADFLHELQSEMGQEEFLAFVRSYCAEFAFKNVDTEAFVDFLISMSPVDVTETVKEYIEA